jgi:beta-glucosidase
MILGRYPEDGLRLFHGSLPDLRAGDLETICQPLDFYGANIYTGQTVRAGASGATEIVPPPDGIPTTAMNWPVTPEALYWGPRFLYERYKLPIVITENGVAVTDWVHTDGRVHDPQRTDYLARHLREVRRALADGVPVQGYFHWTLLDNFEWQMGYRPRFGLIHVDFPTGKRTPKDSAAWYAELIRTRGESLG